MRLLAIIGLAVCAYYLIEVALKWNSRDAIGKGIWFGHRDLRWIVLVHFLDELSRVKEDRRARVFWKILSQLENADQMLPR
jgi:hypothetical protein